MNNIVAQSGDLAAAMVEIRTFHHDSLGRVNGLEGSVRMDANCYWGGSGLFEDNRPGLEFGGNLAQWRIHMNAEAASFTADPLFSGGFDLSASSPCIDAGLAGGGTGGDYYGLPRIPPPDVGAVEYRP